jgi:hypothetical protein
MGKSPSHTVLFYSADSVLIENLARFIATALMADNVAVAILTESHREGLAQRLKEEGFDIDGAKERGTYIPLDAAEMLSTIMINDAPDCVRFFNGLCSLLESAVQASKAEYPRVALCAECVGLLCTEGNMTAALQLEETGNDLIELYDVDILCAYPFDCFHGKEDYSAFDGVCRLHTAVRSLWNQ